MLLGIERDGFIEIDNKRESGTSLYNVLDVIEYQNHLNYYSNRYILSRDDSLELYMLDIQKDGSKNIKITLYTHLETMEFDLNFLSLVGTSPLGYRHPRLDYIDYILYEIIEDDMSDKEIIKYIVSEDELPPNPEKSGYHQDGSGKWYFLSHKHQGELLNFFDHYKRAWRYKQEGYERLLIEMDSIVDFNEMMLIKPEIDIYEGVELSRRDIKLHHPSTVAQQLERVTQLW